MSLVGHLGENISFGLTAQGPALVANTDDYTCDGFDQAYEIILTSTSAINITGILTLPGRKSLYRILINAGTFAITLKAEDTGSAAENRFSGNDTALNSGCAIAVIYDHVGLRWRMLGATGPSGGGSGISQGTSFPGSPATNDLFYRTDLHWLCFYDGTRWLTMEEFAMPGVQTVVVPFANAGTTSFYYMPLRSDYRPYLTRWAISTFVISPNNATNYWTVSLSRWTAAAVATSIASFNTASDTAVTMTPHDQVINAPLNAAGVYLSMDATKVVSPGGLYPLMSLYCRLIVT